MKDEVLMDYLFIILVVSFLLCIITDRESYTYITKNWLYKHNRAKKIIQVVHTLSYILTGISLIALVIFDFLFPMLQLILK